MILPCVSVADTNLDIRNQMLDSEIERYTKTRDEKYAALQQCEKTTKGFKIAGITTLIATGVGVVANVKLSKKLNDKTGFAGGSARVIDNRPQEEKDEDSHDVLCVLDPETAASNGISC